MGYVKRTAGDFLSFCIIFFLLMIIAGNSIATDTITQFQGISVGQTLISSGQMFELGFFSPGNSTNKYVGIWYTNISNQKPVWVANRGSPISISDSNSSLIIGSDGNLRLIDGIKNTVWSTNVSSQANSTIAVLSNMGDLSLKDNVSGVTLWDSFSYPGDTFLSGMEIGTDARAGENRLLTSWQAENDPSVGDFVMGITNERPPQVFVWKSSEPFWRSGPWDGWEFIGAYETGVGYSNGIIVTQDNQQGSVYLTYNSYSDSYVTLVVVAPDGNLIMSHWTIGNGSTAGGATWDAIHIPCDVYNTCGPFGFCDTSKSKMCACLKGFVPSSMEEWNKGNWTGGCVRQAELHCGKNQSDEKSDGFWKLSMMKVPDHHEYVFNQNASNCQQWCLSNCSCMAYADVTGIGCLVWGGELLDIQQLSSNGVDLYLRLASSELDKGKKKIQLVAILTTIPGAILLAAIIYGLYACMAKRRATRRHRIKEVESVVKMDNSASSMREDAQGNDMESSDLPFFHFSTLAVATDNFSEANKLGAGGFGPVYKGKLETGQEIAIKRLSSHSGQGAVEFKNEILLISKLQHRNLVRLIGYSIKGDEKLLIYEYLKNKSLDTFLFDKKKRVELDWAKRFNIIEGIARGILYLHRDSCLRIIHRDLKAGNILLDDNMNPKISDFGLARAFEVTQELATRRVVGTFGYMSPEYAVGGLFSEKSDVFSYGVLLLEIISGMKNTGFQYQEDCVNLLGYAWHLWKEGKGIDLMDKELSDSCTEMDFIKCMQIGLLCVQDYAMERPAMSTVVLMLTGDTDIPQPQQPTFYHSLLSSSVHSESGNAKANKDASISLTEG